MPPVLLPVATLSLLRTEKKGCNGDDAILDVSE
jgi:hypothetical protein